MILAELAKRLDSFVAGRILKLLLDSALRASLPDGHRREQIQLLLVGQFKQVIIRIVLDIRSVAMEECWLCALSKTNERIEAH